jgi:hypothetical protein
VATTASAQSVKTDFDPSVNFGEIKSYFWVKTDPIPNNDLQNGRVVAAIDQWLGSKGWKKNSTPQGDIAVIVNISTAERKSLDTFYSGFGGGYGYYGGWHGGMGSSTTSVQTYTDGTMVVDLFNAQTRKLVWRGIATDTLSKDPKKNANKINKAAEKMFKKDFPPGMAEKKK